MKCMLRPLRYNTVSCSMLHDVVEPKQAKELKIAAPAVL